MRVLIVDDHQVVRRGIRTILQATDGVEICGEAVDGLDAIDKARQLGPDTIVMDVSMPNLNGLEATREIARLLPKIQVIVLSQHDAPEMMRQALKAGARGYVVKSSATTDLVGALEKVRRGEQSYPPEMLESEGKTVDVQEILQRSSAFETALRESEDRLRALVEYQDAVFNNMAEGLYTVDRNGLLTSMNHASEEILGWTKEELLGKKMHDVTHFKYPDGRPFPASECSGLQVLQKGMAIREHEDVFIRKDGTFAPVIYSASPLRENGKIRGVIVGFRDDTEARLAREALLRAKREIELSNEHLLLITDRMAASVTRCSRDLRYLWANQGYADWLQRPLDEIIGHRIEDVLGSEAMTNLRPYFEQVLSGQKVSYEEEVFFQSIGHRWISVAYTPTFDSTDAVDGWVAAIWDVTERKHVDETLRKGEALLD